MDQEQAARERLNYVLCRAGFALISVALVLACFETVLYFPRHLGARPFMLWLLRSPLWDWAGVPIVWGSLIGVFLLWGRWDNRAWQRRTGLLLVFCMIDAGLWLMDHGPELGLGDRDLGNLWFRISVGQAVGWAEFALIASLACEVLTHLGVEAAADTGRSTRALASTGAVLWMLRFMNSTDWQSGWPLQHKRFLTPESFLLNVGWNVVWVITTIQVTALAIAATRQLSEVILELTRDAERNDMFRSRSESPLAWADESRRDDSA